jgi:hypothetical protein
MFVAVLVSDRIRTHRGDGGGGGVRDLDSLSC